MRRVVVIPIEQIKRHFDENSRQDVKIVAPSVLTNELFNNLKANGKDVKHEQRFDDIIWKHSKANEPNNVCESSDFIDYCLPQYAEGPFALGFANKKATQDGHYHRRHLEMYFSENPMSAKYRYLGDSNCESIKLENGGAIIFGPEVIHKMKLGGLTIVIEVPSVTNDKVKEEP